MSFSLEQFTKTLTQHGLLTTDDIGDYVSQTADPESLGRRLLQDQRLTEYQLQQTKLLTESKAAEPLSLGNYIIIDKIGEGGMGRVFKARHRRMDRIVAVKLIRSSAVESTEAIGRFQREVQIAAKLDHPNIVTAFDADEADGIHFLVMEYIDGVDLLRHVRQNGVASLGDGLAYILCAIRGLQHAHSKGVIHRDVKPSNLLLDQTGTVKISDFGLASLSTSAVPGATTQVDITSSGIGLGTLDYLAPEQAENARNADARSDIYSLGCCLYFLLVGKPVYPGETAVAKLLAHRDNDIPRIHIQSTDAGVALNGILRRMMAKNPIDRYQTVKELDRDFHSLRIGESETCTVVLSDAPRPAQPRTSITSRIFETARSGALWRKRVALGLLLFAVGISVLLVSRNNWSNSSPSPHEGAQRILAPVEFRRELQRAIETDTYAEESEPRRRVAKWLLRRASSMSGVSNSTSTGQALTITMVAFQQSPLLTDTSLKSLNDLDHLRILIISDTEISNAGVGHLQGLHSLEQLMLDGNKRLGDGCLLHISRMRGLTSLNLARTGVGDEGLVQLKNLQRLENLNLQETSVTDEGMIHIGSMKNLRYLHLGMTDISDTGLQELKGLTNLLFVGLSRTRVTNDGVKIIGDANPDCMFER